MTTIPRQIVKARRTAGVVLLLSALVTVLILVIVTVRWSTQAMTTPMTVSTITVPLTAESKE